MSQPPDDRHLKALWQGQEPEIPTMTTQTLRMLVKDNEAAERRHILYGVAVGVAVVAILGSQAWFARVPLMRAADLVMLAWAPAMLWMLYRRWPRRTPGPEASAQGLVDFYRAQILRQAPDLRLIGLATAPIMVGLVLLIASIWEKALRMHPSPLWALGGLVVLWGVLTWTQLRRQQRRVRERLRDLDALRG